MPSIDHKMHGVLYRKIPVNKKLVGSKFDIKPNHRDIWTLVREPLPCEFNLSPFKSFRLYQTLDLLTRQSKATVKELIPIFKEGPGDRSNNIASKIRSCQLTLMSHNLVDIERDFRMVFISYRSR